MSKNTSQGPSSDGARAPAGRHRRRAGPVAAVVVLHVAVLWLLASAVGPRAPWRPSRAADAMARPDPAPMTWVTAAPANPPMPDRPAPAPRATGASPSPPRTSRPARVPDRAPVTVLSSAPVAAVPAVVPADAAPPGAPSPGASPMPPNAPLQRALRKEALRELSGGERVWRDDPRLASTPSASVDSRLESGMSSAARGDCLRGDFKGRDMGLLSLPMMGLAAAQGRCRMP